MDRINPEYFKFMDRKIDYLNAQGFIPVIEVARRDITSAGRNITHWPESYSRYIQYVWSRYQANNCLFSPVHYDYPAMTATHETTQPGRQPGHRKIRPPAVRHARLVQCFGFEPDEFRRDERKPMADVSSDWQPAGTRCLLVSDGNFSRRARRDPR